MLLLVHSCDEHVYTYKHTNLSSPPIVKVKLSKTAEVPLIEIPTCFDLVADWMMRKILVKGWEGRMRGGSVVLSLLMKKLVKK